MTKGEILFISTWYPTNIDRWLSTAFEDYGYDVIRVGEKSLTITEYGNLNYCL